MNDVSLRIWCESARQDFAVADFQFEEFAERNVEQIRPDTVDHAGVGDHQAALMIALT